MALGYSTEGVLTSNFFGGSLQNPITSHSLSIGQQADALGGAVGLNAGIFKQFTSRVTWAQGAYAFQVDLGSDVHLGLGGSAGILQYGFRPDSDTGGQSARSETKFDAAAGIFLRSTNVWGGVSMTHIPQPTFSLLSGNYNRALYFSGGGRIYLGGDFSLQPNAQFVRVVAANLLNVNITGDVNETLQAGVTMSRYLNSGSLTRFGGNVSARLANKVDVFFGFLTNPKQAPNFEGGLRLTLD